jgi:hypothetical protein
VYEDLSLLAQQIGRHMAERLTDGQTGHFGDDLLTAFPDAEPKAISLALAELKGEGLVTLTPLINLTLPRIHTTLALFIACDAAITGHSPIEDSVVLARMLIEDNDLGGNARDLEAASGWERRRFNPAFALIVPCIGEGRVRTAYQPDYPVLGVLVSDDDVVRLRRYIRQHIR